MYTHYYQEEMPDIEPCDSNGDFIRDRDYVAFNRSGDVKYGRINDIAQWEWQAREEFGNKKHWYLKCKIIIACQTDNKVSTVSNPNGILSLMDI